MTICIIRAYSFYYNTDGYKPTYLFIDLFLVSRLEPFSDFFIVI